jgi:hypothetical protein
MKKEINIIGMISILSFLLITVLPCQAADVICGCAKTKKGTFRIIDCSSKCLTSEYPVTVSGTVQQNQNPIPNFDGEVCWRVDNGAIMKFRISYIGNNQYLLNGQFYVSEEGIDIAQGSAEMIGSNVYMTINHSGKDDEAMWRGITHIILDTSTLNGTYDAIDNDFNYSNQSLDTKYEGGSLSYVRCNNSRHQRQPGILF